MADHSYEVVFRGDLAPGHHIDDVKQNLAALFKTDRDGVAHLFTGKLTVVKSGLDEATAERYQDAMKGAGALVSIRAQSSHSTDEATNAESKKGELTLAPLGADMLPRRTKPEDRTDSIPTDHISVAKTGSDVLQPSEKKPFVEKQVDTSHLKIQ